MKNILPFIIALLSLNAFSQMRPVINEHFNSSNGWPVGTYESGDLEVSDGVYKFWHKQNTGSWSVYSTTNYTTTDNFIIQSKLKQTKGLPTDKYGIYLYQVDGAKHYFYLTSAGTFEIYHNSNLIANEANASINGMNQYNFMEIKNSGDSTIFSVNGSKLFTTSDYDFTTNKVGWSIEHNNEIHIDNLEIFKEAQPFELVDNFDNNNNNWYIGEANDCMSEIINGKYHFKRSKKEGGNSLNTSFPTDWNQKYSIETQFKINKKGDNDGFGLKFIDENEVSYYYYIKSSGDYVIRIIDGDNDRVIKNTKCPVSFDINSPITLKLERDDNHLNFYVNNQKIESLRHERFLGNKIGFIIYSKMDVEVEYLKMNHTPRPILFVDNYNNGYKKVNIGEGVNSTYNENAPVISSDGNMLFFMRNDYPEITEHWGKENQDIYFSVRDENGIWSKAKSIGFPLNNGSSNFVISITPDMNSLLVGNTYKENGESAGAGLSISHKTENGEWSIPVKLEIDNYVNLNNYVNYTLSPDRKVLVTAIETDISLGDLDLYVSFLKDDDSWTEPQHMGSTINTWNSEYAPFIAADGKTMYVASDGHPGLGNADIFVTKRLDDTWLNWSEPRNLGPEINSSGADSYFRIPASGEVAYMGSTENSLGGNDIFKIQLATDAQPDAVVLIKGKVLNSKTNEPIGANINYTLLKNNEEVGIASSSPQDGSYQITLPYGEKYSFKAVKEGFYPISDNIDLSSLDKYAVIERNLYLAPIEKGEVIRLNNLFFEFDSHELLVESTGELTQLLESLNNNDELKIEIGGHTDNKGSDQYNLELSNRRAIEVMKYLTEHGIDKTRLTAKGYGETKAISTNDTEEGRQLNRRVEFTVISN